MLLEKDWIQWKKIRTSMPEVEEDQDVDAEGRRRSGCRCRYWEIIRMKLLEVEENRIKTLLMEGMDQDVADGRDGSRRC